MKKGILILIILCSLQGLSYSQSIPSYWMNVYNLNDLYSSRSGNMKQIVAEQTVYYSSGGTVHKKWIYHFTDSSKIKGQLFKNGELISNFEYQFNHSHKIIQRTISSKQPLIGWKTVITKDIYEDNHLKYEKKYTRDMQLIDYVQFDYDTANRPVKMTLFDASGRVQSFETADYDENHKKYIYKIYNSAGRLVANKTEFFNLDKTAEQFNKQGELVYFRWPRSNPNKNTFHSLEYKYDEKGNWIKRKWFIVEGKKKTKRSVSTRRFTYSKTK